MGNGFRIIDGRLFELDGSCQPDKCDSFCCRHVQFKIQKINPDDNKYFLDHGCRIVERGDELHVLVPKDCLQLDTLHRRCKIYGDRPSMCINYAMRESDLFKSENCTLRWKRVVGRREQVVMSKIRRGIL